jgi:hypothetical protein
VLRTPATDALQANRSLLLRLLQYNQKGAISERAAMKGPMPGKKL